jgi:hypothetical protein
MPSSKGSGRAAGRRPWRGLVVALVLLAAVLATVLAATYAAFPSLAAGLAPRLAPALGLDELHVTVSRPGSGAMTVHTLELSSGRLHATAAGGTLEYRPMRLLSGRLQRVHFRHVVVRVEAAEDGTGGAASTPPSVESLFAALPADQVSVETLELEVPALDFRAVGRLLVTASHLDAHLEGVTPAEAERFELDAQVAASGAIRVRVGEQGVDQPPFVTVTSAFGTGSLELEGELSIRGFALDLAALLSGLPAGDGTVSGRFSGAVPWPLPPVWDDAVLTANGQLAADWQMRSGPLALSGVAADWRLAEGDLGGAVKAAVSYGAHDFVVRATADRLTLGGAGGSGDVAVSVDTGEDPVAQLSWTLQPDALDLDGSFQLRGALLALAADAAGVPAGQGAFTGRISTRLPWPLPEVQDLPPWAEGSLQGHWQPDQGDIGLDDIEGAWRLEGRRLSGNVKAVATYQGLDMPVALDLAELELEGNAVTAQGTAALGRAVRLPFSASHDIETAAGLLSARGNVSVDAPLAAALMRGWREPYDVTGGEIGVDATLRWPPVDAPGGTVRLDLQALDAYYQDYAVSGLTGRLTFSSADDGTWSLNPSALQVAGVSTGVEVRDVETGIAWSGDQVTVQATTAQLLGGTARADAFAYRIPGGEADFVVDLADLELTRILELEGEQVAGTGILDGSLPVHLRGNVPSIVAGRVRAQPPGGVLRVSSGLAGGTGQPGLDFALRALQDFRYSMLEADVAYSGDGDLSLAVHLQGRNPDIEGGRPIHYNVTVNENVPTLLKSLRLQSDLTREIERRITD